MQLDALWRETRYRLPWNCLFVTPFWLQSVVTHLGAKGDEHILTVSGDDGIVGLAPFALKGDCAYFLGIPDVCDYQDIIAAPGCETLVLEHLLAYLSHRGISRLDLCTLRPDSTFAGAVEKVGPSFRLDINRQPMDVTYETPLPLDWDDYLMQLNGKQRHEIRRKLRRLAENGDYTLRTVDGSGDLDEGISHFLRLFLLNREDKAEFMDETMSTYFRDLIERLAHQQILRLYFLDVEDRPVATVLCFDYNGIRYLYNSGYDAQYRDLSVGVLCKVLSIQKAIEAGCRAYDFLKGAETYKKRIGGREVPLYRYQVSMTG